MVLLVVVLFFSFQLNGSVFICEVAMLAAAVECDTVELVHLRKWSVQLTVKWWCSVLYSDQ